MNECVNVAVPRSDLLGGAGVCQCEVEPAYKTRFREEYRQLKERYEKLKALNNKIEAANMTNCQPIGAVMPKAVEMPKHDCPDYLLKEQQNVMGQYLHILEVRAVIENIEL